METLSLSEAKTNLSKLIDSVFFIVSFLLFSRFEILFYAVRHPAFSSQAYLDLFICEWGMRCIAISKRVYTSLQPVFQKNRCVHRSQRVSRKEIAPWALL